MLRTASRLAIVLLCAVGSAIATAEDADPIRGVWTVITPFGGADMESQLTIERGEGGELSATYVDSRGGRSKLEDVSYADGVLTFSRVRPGRGRIAFEGTVRGDRLKGAHLLGSRRIEAFGARGTEALKSLRAERQKANERGEDIEADYARHSRRAAPRDAFPVLFDPKLTPAAEAKDVRDDEPVIGIALEGEAKAYPVSIMGRHELANDTIAGRPITASW